MSRLANKVAFITGASSGIGAACALRFAEEGAIIVGFDINDSGAEDWSRACELEPRCQLIPGDVRDDNALQAAISKTREQFLQLDILLNLAGIAGIGPVHMVPVEEFDRTMDINLKGTFLACRHALPIMMEQGGGCILNITSVEGLEAQEFTAPYNASKGAVVLLSKNMAIDYGRLGIRVNAICPGFIETPMSAAITEPSMHAAISNAHQLGRMGTAREVANVAAFVASDEASFVSGSALTVDGGFSAGKRFGIAETYGVLQPDKEN